MVVVWEESKGEVGSRALQLAGQARCGEKVRWTMMQRAGSRVAQYLTQRFSFSETKLFEKRSVLYVLEKLHVFFLINSPLILAVFCRENRVHALTLVIPQVLTSASQATKSSIVPHQPALPPLNFHCIQQSYFHPRPRLF